MITQLRQFAKKSKGAIISYQIYDNWRTKQRFNAGKIEFTSGSTHSRKTIQESLSYIDQVFDDYLQYAGISIEMLRDKRILEIGPGDNVGVALKFLAAGAKQVVCLDKFFSKYDWMQQREIYRLLRVQMNEHERHIFDDVIDLETGLKSDSQKLIYIYGTGIEEAEKALEPASFDFIISRAVFEHLYDLDAAFSVMNTLIKPGGSMLHKIDFRDHGIFSGHHPLTFLTIPASVYRLMAYDSGKPNRKLINYYRSKADEFQYDTKILITYIVGSEDEIIPHKETVTYDVDYTDETNALLKEIRPQLQPEFRSMPDEDLMVSGIFLIMRKC